MKNYILTGCPGSGKSSILLYLEIVKGEHIIREAAEDYIRLRQAQGQSAPWTEADFQLNILDIQVQRNAKIPPNAPRVFIDRGYEDGRAYSDDKTLLERISQASKGKRYDLVFLVENLGSTQTNGVRRENHEEALRLEKRVEEIYQGLGYQPVRIPAGPVEDRAKAIMDAISE